jgi:argininosuccinate lyase
VRRADVLAARSRCADGGCASDHKDRFERRWRSPRHSGNFIPSIMKGRRKIQVRESVKAPSAIKSGAPAGKNLLRGRFKAPRLPEVEAFSASLPFDRRLFRHDILGSIAHAKMLAKVGLITSAEAREIAAGLLVIEREITDGRFRFDVADEDIHLAIERRLTEKIGAAGGKLHTARSRNDQVALDFRLYLRDEIAEIIALVRGLRAVLIKVARGNVDTVMPGYTHLQRAQPVSLAHHLLAYVEMLGRDRERLEQTLDRTDVMPLGAGAMAGTTLPIDRRMVARELGFRRIAENSIDAVSDRDFAVDLLAAIALIAVHLSRMSEELILWTSSEFGFAELPDEFSTGSSMMPQKKNPDLLELIRGKSGRIIGDLMAMLTILKGLPLAYNSDLQEDKERVFDAIDTIKPALDLVTKLWPRIRFNRAVMRAAAGGFALATDLAEYLVALGVPFREAHEAVGSLVRDTVAANRSIAELTLADLHRYDSRFGPDAIEALNAESSMRARTLVGGPAPETVRRRLKELGRG